MQYNVLQISGSNVVNLSFRMTAMKRSAVVTGETPEGTPTKHSRQSPQISPGTSPRNLFPS